MPIPAGNTTASAEEQEMSEAGIELASAEEIELAKGVVENVVRYIYSDGAPEIIEQISDGNPQNLGEVAGNLVTNEIALEQEEGRDGRRVERGVRAPLAGGPRDRSPAAEVATGVATHREAEGTGEGSPVEDSTSPVAFVGLSCQGFEQRDRASPLCRRP